MAKISASNVAERTPLKGSKSAPSKAGAIGAALATMILTHAEEMGMAEVRERESRKQTLTRLWDFPSNAEHIAFRNDLTAAMEAIKKQAEAAKLSLNDYCDANPVAAYKRTEVSLWVKMSRAVEHGFNKTVVDLSKPWPAISAAATQHLNNVDQSTGEPGKTNAGPRQRKAGRKATPLLDKVKKFAADNLKDPTTKAPLPKDNRNLANVVGVLCADATLDELNEVAAMIQRMIEAAIKVQAEAKDKIDKASASAKAAHDAAMKGNAGESGTTHTGATVKVSKAGKRTGAPTPTATEHAAASYDPTKQSRLRDGTIVDIPSKATRTIQRKARASA